MLSLMMVAHAEMISKAVCPPITLPSLPVIPTPTRDMNAWLILAMMVIGLPYAFLTLGRRLSGRERSVALLATSLLFILGLLADVTLALYSDSSFALDDWRHQTLVRLGQNGCPGTALDAMYQHAQAAIEPLHTISSLAGQCFGVIGLFVALYLIYLARSGHFSRRTP